MRNHRKPIQRIKTALLAVLPPSVSISVDALDDNASIVKIGREKLVARWAGEGWVKQVRIALSIHPLPQLVVARQMSSGSKEVLNSAGVSWLDETGAASIKIGTIIVSRTGNPPQTPIPDDRWKPSVVSVAESILCLKTATVASIESTTGLSRGSVANALKTLSNLGHLGSSTKRGPKSGRQVVDYGKLLSAYADAAVNLAPKESLSFGVTWQDPVEGLLKLGQTWKKHTIGWFATGSVASVVMAPYLTRVTKAEIYVTAKTMAELESIGTQAGLKPIAGGNLVIKAMPTLSTEKLAKIEDGLPVAPWPRVYADLRKTGVRGEEAAEHLEEKYNGES